MARQMKDSGIEWIGEIPETWQRDKVVRTFSLIGSGTTPKSTDEEQYGGTINWIQSGDINGVVMSFCKNTITEQTLQEYSALKVYQAPFIILAMYGASVGNLSISTIDGCVNQACCVLSMSKCNFQYAFYTLKAAKEYLLRKAVGGGQPNISQDIIRSLWIPQPELEEQHHIAAFLDRKCAEIDAVIERTKTTIEEYKKLKQAVITEAVTKGVRGPRPMKDSGIEWVPELPEEWVVIPSKFLFRNSDVRRQPDDEQLTASQKFGIISQTEYMEREGAKVVLANKGLEDWKHVEPNDFIISLRSFQGGLEMSEVSGCITWHYIVLKPCKTIFSRYFKWLFKSEVYIKALQRTCNFIRDGQDLRYSNFVQVPLYEPSLEEQQEIADYLDVQCAEMDTLIAKKTALLTELETYKKSLIYEYVTGKTECIDVQIQEQAPIVYPSFPAVINTDKPRFAQAVLMSKILDSNVKQMGRVKLEKMLYTIETSIGFDFDTEYAREAAGPLHNSIYECEGIIGHRNKWFTMKQSQHGVSYTPTSSKDKYKKYYDKYFGDYDAEINRIISVFRDYTMDQAEIIATLFAAWNDAIIDQKQFTDEDIVDDVLNNWHESKKRFPRDVWLRAMEQLRKNDLVPKGYGKRTVIKTTEV